MTSLRKCSICWLLSFLVVGVVKLSDPMLARDPPTKSVKGLVTDQAERPLPEAVVQLKNTKTLQVKSFIADENGSYYFHGLDPNVDYELKAQHEGFSSRAHTLSSFDDRREVIYNFALEIPKQKGHSSLLKKGADATVSGVKTVGTATGKDTTTAAKTTADAANTAVTATADATTKAAGATTQGVTTAADATDSGATAAAGAVGAGAQVTAEGAKTVGGATVDGTRAVARGVGRLFGRERPEPEGCSERVVRAQERLKEKGLYDGSVDGIAGPKTAQALRQYQEANNLRADGQLNDQTAKSLGID